jgi:hypothetical protein
VDRLDRVEIVARPLSATEQADLDRRAGEDEAWALERWQRGGRRWWTAVAGAGMLILAAMWWATLRYQKDIQKAAVSTIACSVLIAGFGLWDWREGRKRVSAARKRWAELRELARREPVVEMAVWPVRAWGSDAENWVIDVGEGWAVFTEWDLPQRRPTARIVFRACAAGFSWIDQEGDPCPAAPLVLGSLQETEIYVR